MIENAQELLYNICNIEKSSNFEFCGSWILRNYIKHMKRIKRLNSDELSHDQRFSLRSKRHNSEPTLSKSLEANSRAPLSLSQKKRPSIETSELVRAVGPDDLFPSDT
jgi:hypothetical protein